MDGGKSRTSFIAHCQIQGAIMRSNILLYSCVLFVWISVASAGNKTDYRYDYWYYEPAEAWLKLHRIPANFTEAFFRCNLEGAVLASPLDDKLLKGMQILKEAWKLDSEIYTGIHATISKGDFTSVEGIPFTKIPVAWAADQPDNLDNQEDCIIMNHNGTVSDARCSEPRPYLCYRKKTAEPVITECGTVDTDYKLDKRTGSCYKFHLQTKTWLRAQETCLAEGGYLAIINSDEEATIMKELFSKYPESVIQSTFPSSLALGFLDWDKKGSWYTVNGQRLDEAGYSKWVDGSPNNRQNRHGGQECGSMYRSARLDDFWCDYVPLVFICEKSPNSLFWNDGQFGTK
ncbi:hypothetical protein ABMA27_006380 [Loxostege sticticalis]|uniref:C-type lectin domain-containing protein n=1 Tax=Loxostege sticticalis TaxID=481309 RepID=A0ABR3IJ24_LOXSC